MVKTLLTSFVVINSCFPESFLKQVVETALRHRLKARPEIRRPLDAVLRTLTPEGFRNALKAPFQLQVSAVAEGFKREGSIVAAVTAAWCDAQPELQCAIRRFLAEKRASVYLPEEFLPGFRGMWLEDELRETVDAFVRDHRGEDPEAVRLLLSLLTGRAPAADVGGDEPDQASEGATAIEESDVESADSDSSLVEALDAIATDLEQVPANSAIWKRVEETGESLRELTARKKREREGDRQRLHGTLVALVAEHGKTLQNYFGCAVASWHASSCAIEAVEEASKLVKELDAMLQEHASLSANMGASINDERERRAALNVLETRIESAHQRLSELLLPQRVVADSPPMTEDALSGPPAAEPGQPCDAPGVASVAAGEAHAGDAKAEAVSTRVAEPAAGVERTVPEESPDALPPDELRAALPPVAAQPAVAAIAAEPGPSLQLLTVSDAARALSENDSEEGRLALFWALVAEGSLPAAYWLGKSLAEQGSAQSCPEWLLKAVCGSSWISHESQALVPDLFAITSQHRPGASVSEGLLGLAAALCPAILAPGAGFIDWLRCPSCCPALHPLVAAVEQFADAGHGLHPGDLDGAESDEIRYGALNELVAQARQWLQAAPQRRTKLARATEIWQRLARREMRGLLDPVAANQRSQVSRVIEELKKWEVRSNVLEAIDEVGFEIFGRRMSPIVGDPREQIMRWVREACDLARRWLLLVNRGAESATKGRQFTERIQRLRDEVRAHLAAAVASVDELVSDKQPASVAASASCLKRSVERLAGILRVKKPAPESSVAREVWFERVAPDSLEAGLLRYLLLFPELILDDEGRPEPGQSEQTIRAIWAASLEKRTPDRACEGWVRRQDYRFCEQLLAHVEPEARRLELVRFQREAEEASRRQLRKEGDDATEAVEQLVVDGVLSGEERATFAARIVNVTQAGRLDFWRQFQCLEGIREELRAARQACLDGQQRRWQEIAARLPGSPVPERQQTQIRERIAAAFASCDTRLLDEMLSQLPEVVDGVAELPESWLEIMERRDVFGEFVRMLPVLEDTIKQGLASIINSVRQAQWPMGLELPRSLPRNRWQEVARALEAWQDMRRARHHADAIRPLGEVLRYLGFSLASGGASVTLMEQGGDWIYARARMSAGGLSLVPQFGSSTGGQYDVVCVWERPGVDTIAAWLRDLHLDIHSVLLIYLGRLAPPNRRSMVRMSRSKSVSLLALDETLLLFLGGERDARLPAFMECALPYSRVNPFTPFQAGDVPPEMFFGREAMIEELLRPEGTCVVYGGRQLGKSALLRAAQRRFHKPDHNRFSCVVDIKLVGDQNAGLGPERLWHRLRDALRAAGVLPERATSDKPAEIERYISELCRSVPERQVLVLFDEADHFLDADARTNFPVVTALRNLMTGSNRRFKVVFAGLHNVQRFQDIPNQPLAHFGAPLVVGPLEPDAAYQLVRQPFERLGYRFTDEGAILRILSYTNFHPGLIQLFCQELLKKLHRRSDGDPPFPVEQKDIEAVYRDRQVRDSIRERLEWTLALDARYQAIVWAMVLDQAHARDGYTNAYLATQVLPLVRDCWPAGFATMNSGELRAWLEELRGLGVLVRDAQERYRLRSPNLVHLMGSEDAIWRQVIELSSKRPPQPSDIDSHHILVDEAQNRYSPLSHTQARRLSAPEFGVCLVFGSPALGLKALPAALARMLPHEGDDAATSESAEMPPNLETGEQVEHWLRNFLAERSSYRRLIVHQRLDNAAVDAFARVEAAWRFCRERVHARRQWLRVVFVFDPAATWYWLSQQSQRRQELENRVRGSVALERWNEVGVRGRLEEQQKISTEQAVAAAMRATGGWPILLDELFIRGAAVDDLRLEAQRLFDELRAQESPIAKEFRTGLGLEENACAMRMLRTIADWGEVTEADVSPALFDSEPLLGQEQCDVATEYLLRMGCLVRDSRQMISVEPIVARAVLGK